MGYIFEIAGAVMLSIGGAGFLLFSLSNFLGKIWADRLMLKESANYQEQLIKLKATGEQMLTELGNELEIAKQKHLTSFQDKLTTYRMVIDLLAEMLSEFDRNVLNEKTLDIEKLHAFNRQRLRIYGYLGILAPQSVMDANDNLTDYLLMVAGGTSAYEWERVRSLALILLNSVRVDLAIDASEIKYNGSL